MDSKTRVGIGAAIAVGAALAWFLMRDRADRAEFEDTAAEHRALSAPPAPPILEGPRGGTPHAPVAKKAVAPSDPAMTEKEHDPVTGRIVDEAGRPLAGVAVRLVFRLSATDFEEAQPGGPGLTRATTDADGRFTLKADGDWLVSDSPGWVIDALADSNRTITARPTFVLKASVTNAATGRSVDAFTGHAQWSEHTWKYVGYDGKDGRTEIRGERWWGTDAAAIVDLAVEAKDYVPVQVPVAFGRGEASATAEVRLTPLRPEDMAKTTIDVVDAAGKPFDADWWVRIVDPRDSTQTIQDFPLPERVEAGRYAMTLPPGRWTILVKPNDFLGFLRWTGEVDLRSGENRVRVAMKPHGTLIVRWPPAWTSNPPPGPFFAPLSVWPADGSAGSGVGLRKDQAEFRSTACLEGDWRVAFDGLGGRVEKQARVRAGEETVVDFSPR